MNIILSLLYYGINPNTIGYIYISYKGVVKFGKYVEIIEVK